MLTRNVWLIKIRKTLKTLLDFSLSLLCANTSFGVLQNHYEKMT
jgi:hypothetical protein